MTRMTPMAADSLMAFTKADARCQLHFTASYSCSGHYLNLAYSTGRGFGRRRPFAGETSIISAITNPTTGHSVQWPPHQCWTAVYHSSVVGKKKKPSTGHNADGKIPTNHRENSQSTTMASRGVISASSVKRQGI